tara:strand:+ start:15277 stop:16785 length:1509 start_codon:yes stop_codon:yes gene_type:complete
MVIRKNLKSHALVSVYDKSSLKKLCSIFNKYEIGIISTGATAKKIRSIGFKCSEISNLTKFKEILDGRVKTLNSKIHASLLYNRNNRAHERAFAKLDFPKIDYLISNFYPFTKISNSESEIKKIEMIDIGGPSMIRSASKNFYFLTAICNKKYYNSLIKELDKNKGKTTLSFRKKMAEQNFKATSMYDLSIYKWFKKETLSKKIKIKYGENPNQKAFFESSSNLNILNSQIGGKNIGYNNILDISEGLNCIKEFTEPTCVIIKHNNPCGVASAKNINLAFLKALNADPISSFGGVVLINRNVNEALAKQINKRFFEILVSPELKKKSIDILKNKKKLIIINSSNLKEDEKLIKKSVLSGTLYQEVNKFKLNKSKIKNVTSKKCSEKTINDLIFAFKIAKHVKSNAIVLAQNKQTVGIGAGQMSRIDATRLALMKNKDHSKNKKFVCASDAFFPFEDNIKLLQKKGCKAILQPSGSINDKKIINFCEKYGLPLFFIKNRVFKH